MADEIRKVISITVEGDQTVKGLKEEINLLRDALLNTEQGTQEYQDTLNQLIDDQKQLTAVMNAGKKEVEAAAGSYNALQNEMSALKKVWKEVTDEASRNEIGTRILEINNQLKEMDGSIGNFQRNVGDYEGAIVDASKNIMQNLGEISPALGGMGKNINQLVPLIQKATKTATTGLNGIKKAIVGTGIGALVVALGLLIANWQKVSDAIAKVIPWMKKANEETQKQVEANNQLVESNKAVTEEMDFQARIMAAQGKSTLEIIEYKKKETEAILANTEAQIAETNAKIASIKAHSAFGRWIRGENKQLKELEESLESLTKEQEAVVKSLKRLNQDIVVEETKLQYERTKETTKGSDNRKNKEKDEAAERLKIIEGFIQKAKELEESYYTEAEKIEKSFSEKRKTVLEGMYGSILSSVGDSDEVRKQLDEIFAQENFEDIVASLAKAFGNNGDFARIIKEYTDLWQKVLDENQSNLKKLSEDNKKKYGKILEENIENIIKSNKTILAKNKEEVENEKEKAREIYDASKQTYEDKKALREAEYQADKRYSELEIQLLQTELDKYRKISADKNSDDETRLQAKEKVTDLEIELIQKLRNSRNAEKEKLKQDNEEEKAMLEERKENILAFSEAIGDILGSIGDYWMDYVQDQVDAGKMSEEEGEKQFKWIKALQIAQTTIQTISAAMAAFNGITSSTGGWGIAAAAAEMAAVLTTGALQIAKIKNTHIKKSDGGSSSIASGAQVKTINTDFNPQYVAAQTGQSETDNLRNAMAGANYYVNVVEVENLMEKRKVRTEEATF